MDRETQAHNLGGSRSEKENPMFKLHSRCTQQESHSSRNRSRIRAGVLGAGVALTAAATLGAGAAYADTPNNTPVTRGANTGGNLDIKLRAQGLLLTDGTVVLTVDYSCPPGSGDATIYTGALQESKTGSGNAPATCDGGSHTANIRTGPGPFSAPLVDAFAVLKTSAGSRESDLAVVVG
jgi:hypothetical protein